MKQQTAVTLMAGGGGKAIGAAAAGYDLVGAVECDPAIAEVYAQNVSKHVHVGKVELADPRPFIGIDALLASPVCSRMSIANANRGETDVDRIAAEGVCRWLRVCRPHLFVMENVTQYLPSDSCQGILACLREMGYQYDVQTVNAADIGVPQTRRRLIVRAVLGGPVPPLIPTHASPDALRRRHGTASLFDAPLLPWMGWYTAIADIIDTLPPSQFAAWQLARLPDLLDDTLLENINTSRPATCRTSQEPSHTLTTAQCGRRQANMPMAWLVEGRVVRMTPRALARFMTFPDWYVLPKKASLAGTILGNAVPCLLAEAIMRSFDR
jgi:DNA (cytosine-5)-methyltransferase 1